MGIQFSIAKGNLNANEHLVKDCKLTEYETNVCANCGGNHRSYDTNCEVLQLVEARKNAKNKLQGIPKTFTLNNVEFLQIGSEHQHPTTSVNNAWTNRIIKTLQRPPETQQQQDNFSLATLFQDLRRCFDFTKIANTVKNTVNKLKSSPDSVSNLLIITEPIFSFFD